MWSSINVWTLRQRGSWHFLRDFFSPSDITKTTNGGETANSCRTDLTKIGFCSTLLSVQRPSYWSSHHLIHVDTPAPHLYHIGLFFFCPLKYVWIPLSCFSLALHLFYLYRLKQLAEVVWARPHSSRYFLLLSSVLPTQMFMLPTPLCMPVIVQVHNLPIVWLSKHL